MVPCHDLGGAALGPAAPRLSAAGSTEVCRRHTTVAAQPRRLFAEAIVQSMCCVHGGYNAAGRPKQAV